MNRGDRNQEKKGKKNGRTLGTSNLGDERKKRKKEQGRPNPGEERKKKKKGRTGRPNLGKEREEKKKRKRCGWYCLWVPHMCLITKMPLSYELWKLKIAKMCF